MPQIPSAGDAVTPGSGEVLAALRAADPATPEALSIFDRIAGAPDPAPDFIEWSARIAAGCDAARLTYYFDAARHGAEGLRAAGRRFEALASALGAVAPAGLGGAFASAVAGHPEVMQVVLGIDERPGGERRVKLYVVLQGAAAGLVDGLIEAAGGRRPGALDPSKVYILGLDFGARGLVDAKLYFRLDLARLGRAVANLGEVRDLVEATRYVVLQCCTLDDRRQLYLHADNPTAIARYLARRARTDAAAAQLCARQAAAARHLGRGRLEPWIISFGLRERRLDLGTSNVYYHHAGADDPGARPHEPV